MSQPHKVAAYFDEIARDYESRYGTNRPYHRYLHTERLRLTTEGLHIEGKRVLDIGAGTGPVYEALRGRGCHYFALDISAEMLAASNIPEAQRFCGSLQDAPLPYPVFDVVFMLGVTTYLPPDELADTLQRVQRLLAPGGVFIVTFTNPRSLDWQIRRFIRLFWRGKGVIGQGFATFAYRPELPDGLFDTCHVHYYNAGITPFNTLLPGLSTNVARLADRLLPTFLKKHACADAVVWCEKHL